MIPLPKGGGGFDLGDIRKIETGQFSSSAPYFRSIGKGLSLKYKCDTCKETICITLGFCENKKYFRISEILGD